uniref:Ig-like domain-containing protein n=1 Tax=Sinocyclocheilus grahami TaxID=75366 RepID=A0A672QGX9_SINGR
MFGFFFHFLSILSNRISYFLPFQLSTIQVTMGFLETHLVLGIVLLGVFSGMDELILTPHSEFTITCSGERRVTWVEPLPRNSEVQSGFNHSTLVITDAVASNTGYYTCTLLFRTTKYIYIKSLVSYPEVPFVSEPAVETDEVGTIIPCRATNPHSQVILRNLQSGDEVSVLYDPKLGFFGVLSPGHYVCEMSVNGKAMHSIVYNLTNDKGK